MPLTLLWLIKNWFSTPLIAWMINMRFLWLLQPTLGCASLLMNFAPNSLCMSPGLHTWASHPLLLPPPIRLLPPLPRSLLPQPPLVLFPILTPDVVLEVIGAVIIQLGVTIVVEVAAPTTTIAVMMYTRSQTPKAKNEKMENPGQKICTGLSTAVRPTHGWKRKWNKGRKERDSQVFFKRY